MTTSPGSSTLLPTLVSSAGITLFSEFGDKTFFVAAILASKYSPLLVYFSCWSALATMTLVSGFLGTLVPQLASLLPFIPGFVPKLVSAGLLMVFGGQMLYEGLQPFLEKHANLDKHTKTKSSLGSVNEEEKEAEEQIEQSNLAKKSSNHHIFQSISKLFGDNNMKPEDIAFVAEVFVMTFVAEWGDKSQFTTVALSSSASSAVGVLLGGVVGHAACTGLAVTFGRAVSDQLPEEHFNIAGGSLLLLFGLQLVVF